MNGARTDDAFGRQTKPTYLVGRKRTFPFYIRVLYKYESHAQLTSDTQPAVRDEGTFQRGWLLSSVILSACHVGNLFVDSTPHRVVVKGISK